MNVDKAKKAADKVPFYLVYGKKDEVMPVSLGGDARDYLKKNGFRVNMVEFDGGHKLPDSYFDILKDAILWFHKELRTN